MFEVLTGGIGLSFSFLIYRYRSELQAVLKLDYILLAYSFGMLTRWLVGDLLSEEVLKGLIYGSVPLAMPLLIFQADFFRWIKSAPLFVRSFFIACACTFSVGLGIGKLWALEETTKKIVAMLVGVYIGGTPNLNAIGLSLQVPLEAITAAATVDFMASSLFLLFMLFLAKPLFQKILPYPFPSSSMGVAETSLPSQEKWIDKVLPILLSVLIFGVSVAISYAIFKDLSIPLVMLVITLLGIAGSLNKKIRNFSMNDSYGNYLITVFCFSTGLMIDITRLFEQINTLFWIPFSIIFVSLALQVVVSRLFRVNAEVMMICAIACVMSPAFIPMFVKRYQNDELLLPGITAGLLGFAIANMMGLGLYALL